MNQKCIFGEKLLQGIESKFNPVIILSLDDCGLVPLITPIIIEDVSVATNSKERPIDILAHQLSN